MGETRSTHHRRDRLYRMVGAFVCVSGVASATASTDLEPFLSTYCYSCHDSDVQKADLNLQSLMRGGDPAIDDAAQWQTVLHMISTGEMPPEKKPQPKQTERETAAASITGMLRKWAESLGETPGRVTARRLNRDEYNNTIRDLLAIDFKPAKNFPRDEVGYGFDNIGDVLSLSPVLMEKYLDAAEQISVAAILSEIPEWPPAYRPEPEELELLSWEEDLLAIPLQGAWEASFRADGSAEPPASATLTFSPTANIGDLRVQGKRAEFSAEVGLNGASRRVVVQAEERGGGRLVGQWNSGEMKGGFEARAIAGAALAGTWDAVASLPDGRDIKQVLTLKAEEDGHLGGRMESSDNRVMEITSATADGDELVIKFETEIENSSREVVLRAAIAGGELRGGWTIAGPEGAETTKGDWKARPRTKPAGDQNVRLMGRSVGFFREGEARLIRAVEETGAYELKFKANQQRGGPENAMLGLFLDGREIERIDVEWDKPEPVVRQLNLEAGEHSIALAFLNNYNNSNARDRSLRGDRNMFAGDLQLTGPLGRPRPPLPESHRRVIPEQPAAGTEKEAARRLISEFASRAFRRPAREAEVDRIAALVEFVREDGGTFYEGMRLATQAVLASPNFLFRWELDSAHASPEGIRNLNAYEIASRLSYFLWSSMPDEELFALAMDGSLRDENVIRRQVGRMLADSKSEALVRNFAGQWLQIRNLETIEPDAALFPEFDDALRHSMAEETYLFFNAILREDRSVLELLDADFTFLNKRLARHYGIDSGIDGERFQRVSLPEGSQRGGVLGQAGILTITSNPTRTSPVNRGKWVLEQILGTPPPPPPPNVPQLEESKEAVAGASLRERMRLHREKPDCAGCHAKMDPIGFALENYDALGRWRDFDGQFPIDPAGTLADGTEVSGPESLKTSLRNRPEYVNALIEKMLTYALGRGIEFTDRLEVERIRDKTSQKGFKLSEIIVEIACSTPFIKQSIEIPSP